MTAKRRVSRGVWFRAGGELGRDRRLDLDRMLQPHEQQALGTPRDGLKLLNRTTGQELRYAGTWRAATKPTALSGGTVVDSEARTAIAAIIAALTTAGIVTGS